MSVEATLRAALTNSTVLIGWLALVVASLSVLVWDLRTSNRSIESLMQLVWVLTVVYSGPLGLAVYWYAGRSQITSDTLWRRAFRSVAHCYSGCGAGEVIGVTLAAGLLALDTAPVIAITFACAYAMGYALTVGPLLQDGVGIVEAVTDAFFAETPSITIMEIAAIGTDVWLAGEAHIGELLLWTGLIFSLTIGFVVAYPVNVMLIHEGVKDGMGNPAAV